MILRTLTQNSALLLLTYPLTIFVILLCGWNEMIWHWAESNTQFPWNLGWGILLSLGVFINAFLINNLYNNNELYVQPSYLTGWIYCLGSSIAMVQFPNLQFWIGEFFFILSCYFSFQIFRQKRVFHLILLSALFGGIACLFHAIYLFIPIFILIGVNLTRPFSLKETALFIVGFFIPWIYFNAYHFSSQDHVYWTPNFKLALQDSKPIHLQFQFWLYIVILLLSILGVLHKDDRQTNKTQQSKNLILLLVFSASITMLTWSIWNSPQQMPFFTAPWLLIWGHYWTHYRTSLLAPIFFYLWLITCVLVFLHWL